MNYHGKLVACIIAVLALSGSDTSAKPERSWTVPTSWLPRPTNEKPSPLLIDPAALQAFVDRELGAKIDKSHIGGAVFVAVKGDRIIMEKGYGFTNVATRTPVDPAKSLFFVASISKIMLGTAVMRMVERGELSLDADVVKLDPDLGLQSKLIGGQKVTLRNFLTHSSGFQDILLNSGTPDAREFTRVGAFIRRYMPQQSAAPGTFVDYSNAGISAVGAVVEKITGKPLEMVLDQEVFHPLGMRQAVVNIPLNPEVSRFKNEFVTPYVWDSGKQKLEAQSQALFLDYPAGSVAMSGEAAARFMSVFINQGRMGDKQYLKPQTVALMLSKQTWNNPRVPGFGITFKEGMRNGVLYVGHSGDYRGNESMLTFFPAYGMGFFISYTGGADTFYRDFFDHFMDKVFPPQSETVHAIPSAKSDLRNLQGEYAMYRFHLKDPLGLVWPLSGKMLASVGDDGTLKFDYASYYFHGGATRYAEVQPDLYRIVDRGPEGSIGPMLNDYLAVKRDAHGKVIGLATTVQNHPFVLVPLSWIETQSGLISAWIFIVVCALVPLIAGLIFGGIRLAQRAAIVQSTAGWLVAGGSILAAVASIGFVTAFYGIILTTHPSYNVIFGLDHLGLGPVLAAPFLSIMAAVICAMGGIGAMHQAGTGGKLGAAMAAIAFFGAIAFIALTARFDVFAFALRGGAAG